MKTRLIISMALLAIVLNAVGGGTNYVSLTGGHCPPFTCWATAATNIQAAVDAEGDTVVISNGTYCLDEILIIPAGHTVVGLNGAEQTIIDGMDAVRCVRMVDSELRGITVAHGYYVGDGSVAWPATYGAGMHAEGSVILSCVIRDNYSGGEKGSGMYATGCIVSNCIFQDNRTAYAVSTDCHGWTTRYPGYGAGMYCSDTKVSDCLFRRNVSQYGGGAYAIGFSEIRKCRIENNSAEYGGGVYVGSDALITQTRIANNRAEFGGGLYIKRGGTFRSCFVFQNDADSGGAAYLLGTGMIESCTLVDNGGTNSIYWKASLDPAEDTVVRNCIVWPNVVDLSSKMPGATLSHNCFDDPHLVESNSCLLAETSPCIDAGTNLVWMTGAQDFLGNDRLQSNADIGACEASAAAFDILGAPTAGIAPFSVRFNALCSQTHADELNFEWDFDNDGIMDDAGWGKTSVSHTYQKTGTYSVVLSVGNATVRRRHIEVLPPVEADFFVNSYTAAAPATISFHDRSRYEPQFWSWDLDGDGLTDSTNRSSSYTFTEVGTYAATLTVSNDFGAGGFSSDSKSCSVTIIPPVNARFKVSPAVVLPGETVYFADESEHAPTTWRWSFGEDGATANSQDAQFSYDTPGWKTVTLVAGNAYSSSTCTQERAVRVLAPTPIHYVSASGSHTPPFTNWVTAATNIQAAIAASEVPDTVHIGSGIYTSSGVSKNGTNVFVLNKDVEIMGGADTIIDGQDRMRGACLLGGITRNLIFKNGAAEKNAGVSNSGEGGGVWIKDAELVNCVLCQNYAEVKGGGVYIFGGTIRNCTIVDNSAGEQCGGLYAYSYIEWPNMGGGTISVVGESFIQNSIIQHNEASADAEYNGIYSSHFIHCCLTPLPWVGTGNITNSPLFCGVDDYRLSADSLCINAGTNQVWMVGATDAEEKPRILYGAVDMGAYEYFEGPHITGVPGLESNCTWTTMPGATYQLQVCDNLLNPQWQNVGAPLTSTGTTLSVCVPGSGAPRRFYRVILTEWPPEE